jgi:ribosomal protein S18 acetylase RimI-like enzyme
MPDDPALMIRQALRGDEPSAIPLMLEAIGSIALVLTGTENVQEAAPILSDFFRQEGNRVSYQNVLVLEDDGQVVGLVLTYDGARARGLDKPLEAAAARRLANPNYRIPSEPEESEFYLDTVSVSPGCRGRGYGSRLIEEACRRGRKQGHRRIALLVDVDNNEARRLYERLGFKTEGTKNIAGYDYWHMVREL